MEPASRRTLFVALACVCLCASFKLEIARLWDDAYIFVRYADNLLSTGRLAWNRDGPAAYGLTSLLFLLVVAPVRACGVSSPAVAAALSSFACGLGFLAIAVRIATMGAVTPSEAASRRMLVAWTLALSAPALATHFVSGMETTFALAFGGAYMLAAAHLFEKPSPPRALAVGIVGGLAWWARPELVVASITLPLAVVVWDAEDARVAAARIALFVTLCTLTLELVIAYFVLGSALPLPFFVKQRGLQDMTMGTYGVLLPWRELAVFAGRHSLLLVAPLVAAVMAGHRATLSPLERGSWIAALLVILYHLLAVVPVMAADQRFDYATLPLLLLGGTQAAGRLHAAVVGGDGALPASAKRGAVLVGVLAFGAVAISVVQLATDRIQRPGAWRFGTQDLPPGYDRHWYKLDAISHLPDDLVIATADVGYPGVMNPEKPILDLAGLNEPSLALHLESLDQVLRRRLPDVIYMPRPLYRGLRSAFAGSRAFREDYECHAVSRVGAYTDVAVRRQSRYHRQLTAMLREPSTPGRSAGEGGCP